ncbi:hypothetical protein [Longispora albida]|uniref:hypothetical protein n=1 Tax=Longispora albida TaxID=203523 RepID=UPI000367EC25|nr:hypothetical protein [Longispora albida]
MKTVFGQQVEYWAKRGQLSDEDAADRVIEAVEKAGAGRFGFLLRTDQRFRVWSLGGE